MWSQSEHCVSVAQDENYGTGSILKAPAHSMPLSSSLPSIALKGHHWPDFYDRRSIGFLSGLTTWACVPRYHSLVCLAYSEKGLNLTRNQEDSNEKHDVITLYTQQNDEN